MYQRHLALAVLLNALIIFGIIAMPMYSHSQVLTFGLFSNILFFIASFINYTLKINKNKKSLLNKEDFLKSTIPGTALAIILTAILFLLNGLLFR